MQRFILFIVACLLSQQLMAQSYSGKLEELKVNEDGAWVLVLNGKAYQASGRIVVRYNNVLLPLSELKGFPLRVSYQLGREANIDKVKVLSLEQEIEQYENLNH